MSVQYSGGYEVYCTLDKMFNDLYKNNEHFMGEINTKGFVGFEKVEDKVFKSKSNISLKSSYVGKAFEGVRDEDYNDDFNDLVNFSFGEEFLYKKEEAYLYVNEVTCDSDDGYGTTIVDNSFVDEYPKMKDVLTRKGDTKTWKYLKGIPKEFKKVIDMLNSIISDDVGFYTIGRVHMVEDEMCITAYCPYEVCGVFKWDYNDELKELSEKLIKALSSFKYSVKEVYWFSKGNISNIKIRMNTDGEVTIVVL